MAEELYEELPADGYEEEELYEDLPDSAYQAANQYPIPTPVSPSYNTGGGAPPPLPTGPIPQHRPGASPPPTQMTAPPLPTRAPSTAITTPQTTPTRKQEKAAKPPAKKKAPPPKAPKSGGGGGINMKEIMQKARTGDRASALEQLENKSKNKPEDGQSNPAPWANQLRKTGVSRQRDEESTSPPPWVKRSSQVEMDAQNPDDVTPEFIRKARTMSRNELDVKKPPSPEVGLKPPPKASKPPPSPRPAPKPAVKPPPVAKPRNIPNPEGFQPKAPNIQAEDSEKPAWLKQRERQAMLAKGDGEEEAENRPPPPASKPPPSNKPPPPAAAEGTPPAVSKKPPPKPAPRKPSEVPAPINIQQTSEPISQESPPTTPSVRERARTLERGAKQRIPTPPESPVVPVPPRGALSDSPPLQPSPNILPKPGPKSPPPAPPTEERLPKLPDRPPPSTRPPPPTSAPPPSLAMPPLPDRPPPSSRPPVTLPIEPTQTFGEPTPPIGMVMKYRRRPLRSVDPFSPPPRPSVSTKPQYAGNALNEDDEIYDDTVALQEEVNGETEELYDDVTQSQLNMPPPRPLPSTTPPPGPPSDVPPPLPASLPPSARPAVSTIPTDDMPNGITSSASNGDFIPPDDQETYEDLESATEAYQTALLSQPSVSSLAPRSPQHTSPSPNTSPTLGRKNKLTKEEKKAAKEEEKKRKEKEKLDKEREKERKKKEEARMKNRVKGLKAFKQFELKPDVEPLFAVEVLLEHGKTKDHLSVTEGEVARVLLIGHPKLPQDRYLIEKEDGTIGYLKKNICQRTAYQSAASILDVPPQPVANAFQDDEDIYESLPQGEGDEDFPDALGPITPSLPPPNPSRFPPPSQPAPPPPPPPMDGPEDNYEYLPGELEAN